MGISTVLLILVDDLNLCITFSDNLREELVASGIADITRELSLHGDEKVKEVAKSVLAFIDDSPVNR